MSQPAARTLTPRAVSKSRSRKHPLRSMLGTYGPPRCWVLTPEGAATVTTVERHADSEAGAVTRRNGIPPVVASSGHIHCHPSIRHLCEGRLPWGWVRAGGAS